METDLILIGFCSETCSESAQIQCFWSESAQKNWPYLCHLGSKKFWADLIISDQIPLRIPASQQRPPLYSLLVFPPQMSVCNFISGWNIVELHKQSSIYLVDSLFSCVMQPSGSPYFQVPSPVAAIAGRVDSFDRGQAGNFQLFLPTHLRGRPTELATSESTGTNSSQYSIPSNNLSFKNYKVLIFDSCI